MIADGETMARLMALAQAGDRTAYRTVLTSSMKWLGRYYSGKIHPCAVDDLVQDTLTSLHAKRATYVPARPFFPWLAAIARYRWIDQLRRTYRANEHELGDDLASPEEEESAVARLSLDKLLGLLPASQSTAIRLVKIEGQSIAEAAEMTGQSEPLVKVNIHRGLKKLTALIERNDA